MRWWLSRTVLGAVLVLVALVCASVPALAAAPLVPSPAHGAVVLVDVPGLRWEDVSARRTPNLAALTRTSAIGSLAVQTGAATGTEPAAPADPARAWSTLGSGNRSDRPGWPLRYVLSMNAVPVHLLGPTPSSPYGTPPTSPDEVARTVGSVSGTRALVVVYSALASPLGTPTGTFAAGGSSGPAPRSGSELAAADRLVGAVLAARGPSDTVLLVGGSDDSSGPRLRVAAAHGPYHPDGWLTSASTRRPSYVQLFDVAPTVLSLLDVPVPSSMAGRPWTVAAPEHGPALGGTRDVGVLEAQDRAAASQVSTVPVFFSVVAVLELSLVALVVALRHRPRLRSGLRHAALVVASIPVATFLADLLPWWENPSVRLPIAVTSFALASWGLSVAGPWRVLPWAPPALVAGLTALVLGVDVVTGAHLQLDSVGGYSSLVGIRYAGLGNTAFALFGAAVVVLAALLASRSSRPLLVVVPLGVLATLVDGNPHWGDDGGGVLTLVPTFALLCALLVRRHRLRLLLLGAVLAVGAATSFALLDAARPEPERSHLGRFALSALADPQVVVHALGAQLDVLLLRPVSVLVLVPLLAVLLLLGFGSPAVRAALADPPLRVALWGSLTVATLGALVNDSAAIVTAACTLLALPLLLALALGRPGQVPAPSALTGR